MFAPALLLASWLPGAIAGAVVGALVAFGIWSWQKRAATTALASEAAAEAGLVASPEADALPTGLEAVAVLNAGRSRKVTSVASGEHAGRAVTTLALRFTTGGLHSPTLWRYVVVHLPDAGTPELHAVSLPARAPEGILESFGNLPVDAPRTVRGNDAAAAAAWASRPALLEAAGEDALFETGPAGLTMLVPGEVAQGEELQTLLDRAVAAAATGESPRAEG